MAITDIATEQTTAVTDLILAALASVVSGSIYKTGNSRDKKKARLWAWAFGLLVIASLFGAAAHGFKMTERMNFILWQPVNLALGLTISLFAAGVVYDLKKPVLTLPLLIVFLTGGLIFYVITVLIPGTFIIFIFYEAIAMVFALISYLILSFRKKRRDYGFMAIGIMLSIIAAGIQATDSIRFTFIWEFDHNGVFHLIQMPGLVFLLAGLRSGFLARPLSEEHLNNL
jgi:glucose uptake protein GlcU